MYYFSCFQPLLCNGVAHLGMEFERFFFPPCFRLLYLVSSWCTVKSTLSGSSSVSSADNQFSWLGKSPAYRFSIFQATLLLQESSLISIQNFLTVHTKQNPPPASAEHSNPHWKHSHSPTA